MACMTSMRNADLSIRLIDGITSRKLAWLEKNRPRRFRQTCRRAKIRWRYKKEG